MKYILDGQQTQRLSFRKIKESDFNIWLEFHKDPRSTAHWIEEKEDPKVVCEKWYKRQFYRYENNLGGMNAIIEKTSGKLIGHCGLLVQNVNDVTELETGYSLLTEFWNKGYATESAKKCLEYAFENDFQDDFQGSIISIISKTNKASENVALKNGMRIDRETEYAGNNVNIFRINKTVWEINKTSQI